MSPAPGSSAPSVPSPRLSRRAVGLAVAIGALGVLAALAAGVFAPQPELPGAAPLAGDVPRQRARTADIIDVHVHVSPRGVPRLLELMQTHGIRKAVNLSGGDPLSGL